MSEGQGEFRGVIGFFGDVQHLRDAVARAEPPHLRDRAERLYERLRALLGAARRPHLWEMEAYLPVYDRKSLALLHPGPSWVKWIALAGGIFGIAVALLMTLWMSWDYRLIVGGKPTTAWPPFLIVCYELMTMFGALAAVGGLMLLGGMTGLTPSTAYDPEVAVDRFALFLPCTEEGEERTRADTILREAGALEVREVRSGDRTQLDMPAAEREG